MKKYKAIPEGFMTIGEIAKKMGVTVRTLQYYDKEGILPSSSESDGGRRLYTNKDIVKLHQIQSMKYLGFSLEEIKNRLPLINTSKEVVSILKKQSNMILDKINSLTEVLNSIEKLSIEVQQMKTVDWNRYADIIVLLQNKSELYWMMKGFDEKMLDYIHDFDTKKAETLIKIQRQVYETIGEYQKMGICPESKQGQILAKDFWDIIMEFTKGDMTMLPELHKVAMQQGNSEWKNKQEFIEKALDLYLKSQGHNSFKEMVNSD